MEPLRTLTAAEVRTAMADVELAFGGAVSEADTELELTLLDPDRCLGVLEDGRAVLTAAWMPFVMTVPGAALPLAAVSWVSVAPTHRRRGLLTAGLTRLLSDVRDEGTPVAALWASEGAIYQRFGFGPAVWHTVVEVPSGAAFTRTVDTTGLRLREPSAEVLAPLHDPVAAVRPGWWRRDDTWWAYRLHDPDSRRDGGSPLRCVVDGEDGYALYSTQAAWENQSPVGTVRLRELVSRTPRTTARLWRYLLDLDLMKTVTAGGCSVDDPLLSLLANPRSARARIVDALWVRLVRLDDALSARRYVAPVDVVLEVTDRHCPWNAGRWHLSGDSTGASCVPTSAEPHLVLDVRELGAAYLGGTSLSSRAEAGWIEERSPGSLAATSAAFGWTGGRPTSPMGF